MDLHILGIFVLVLLVSLISWVVISKTPRGKTFDEALAEKKQLAVKLYGTTKTTKKMLKKPPKKNKEKLNKKPKEKKEATESVNDHDSEDHFSVDDEIVLEEKSQPRKVTIELEAASIKGNNKRLNPKKEQPSKTDLPKSVEVVDVEQKVVVAPLEGKRKLENQPKASKTESNVNLQRQLKNGTNSKGFNKQKRNDALPNAVAEASSSSTSEVDAVVIESKESKDILDKNQKMVESPKVKDRNGPKKKKSSDLTEIKRIAATNENETLTMNYLITALNKVELTRNEIQILIDYLLNKQQDTAVASNFEWSDDVVEKIRKQLVEKEKALIEQQEIVNGFETKLRELRAEYNNDRHQNKSKMVSLIEEVSSVNRELRSVCDEKQVLEEKLPTLQQQIINLEHMLQESKMQLANESRKNCMINEEHCRLLRDNNQYQADIKHLEHELQTARHEQKVLANNEGVEILNLRNTFQAHKVEADQKINELSNRINELNHQLIQRQQEIDRYKADHINETATLKDTVNQLKNGVTEKELRLHEYETLVKSLTQKDMELHREISEIREKNNELRTRNWKLIEALKIAEKHSSTTSVNVAPAPSEVDTKSLVRNEQNRIRDELSTILPEINVKSNNFEDWLITLKEYIRQQQTELENTVNNSNSHNAIYNNHHHNNHNNSKTTVNNVINNKYSNDVSKLSTTPIEITSFEPNGDISNIVVGKEEVNGVAKNELLSQIAEVEEKYNLAVNELKRVTAESSSVLANLEEELRGRDKYWQNVVHQKDNEIAELSSLQKTIGTNDLSL